MKDELKELRTKSNKELLAELKKSYEVLRNFRFQAKMSELKDINQIKKIKKKIAIILTILREQIEKDVTKKPQDKGEK